MKKSPWLGYFMLLIKTMVFIAACYFIYQTIIDNLTTLKAIEFNSVWLLTACILMSVTVYTALMMLLVFAWLTLLQFKHPQPCAKYYFKSQILKYIPGNVFHFAYRHSQTKKLGFGHKRLIRATLFETLGLLIAALVTANALLLWPSQIPWVTQWLPLPYWPLVLLELVTLVFAIKVILKSGAYTTLACYLIYFLGMGWIAYALIASLGLQTQPYLFITACFAAAWLAGYVIPGAPGGMGVREAVFILLASPQIIAAEALILIALIRLISIAAETIIYFIAPQISQPYRHLAAWSDKTMP